MRESWRMNESTNETNDCPRSRSLSLSHTHTHTHTHTPPPPPNPSFVPSFPRFERAEEYAKSIGASIMDTSAKSDENVEEIFNQVAEKAVHVVAARQLSAEARGAPGGRDALSFRELGMGKADLRPGEVDGKGGGCGC